MFKRAPAFSAGVIFSLASAFAVAQQPEGQKFRELEEGRQNRSFDRPEINPSPQKTLIVQGRKSEGLEIWFATGYETALPECKTQTLSARLFGAPDVPQVVYSWVRVPAEQTEFSVSFFLDRYLPGHCNWQPFSVNRAVFDPQATIGPKGISGVVSLRLVGKQKTRITWQCTRIPEQRNPQKPPYISCITTQPFVYENTVVSTDGGVVEVEFTLAPDADGS